MAPAIFVVAGFGQCDPGRRVADPSRVTSASRDDPGAGCFLASATPIYWLWPRPNQASKWRPGRDHNVGCKLRLLDQHHLVRADVFAIDDEALLHAGFKAELRLDRPTYKLGDELRLTITVERECNLLLLERRSDATIVQLFPSPSNPFPRARAGVSHTIPPIDEPAWLVSAPVGPRVIRLLAFPIGVDSESLSPAQLELVLARLTVVEQSCEVVER